MKKKPRVALWSVLTALCAILLVASFVANLFANRYATTLNVALNTSYSKVVNYDPSALYFTSDFDSDAARWEYEKELCAVVEAEGAALLRNDNAALPLPEGAKVTVVGSDAPLATRRDGANTVVSVPGEFASAKVPFALKCALK